MLIRSLKVLVNLVIDLSNNKGSLIKDRIAEIQGRNLTVLIGILKTDYLDLPTILANNINKTLKEILYQLHPSAPCFSTPTRILKPLDSFPFSSWTTTNASLLKTLIYPFCPIL
ncbi:hypothetical protein J3Q64DRAFT_1695932 [Phycomyces blakesleeanus]|uniref:Uncharacterized protein n=1 Tax=Phycomyces blakesleeanus TaxID=4837 RepID=A0ABR3B7E4_PHYBL